MPLLDHFNPPLSRTHPWRSFHGAWAGTMARLLNQGVLPAGYYAIPLVDRDGPIEIDVAALREHDALAPGGATAPQACARPALAASAAARRALAGSPPGDRRGRPRAPRPGSQLPGDLRRPAYPSGDVR